MAAYLPALLRLNALFLKDFERHRHLLLFVCIVYSKPLLLLFKKSFFFFISFLKSKFSTMYFSVKCFKVVHRLQLDGQSFPS